MTGEEGRDDDAASRLASVAGAFCVPGPITAWRSLPGGHIHGSYAVDVGAETFVLQRLNRTVFVDVTALVDNVRRVVEHLRSRRMTAPELVTTHAGAWTHPDPGGAVWRMWRAIDGVETRTEVTAPAAAYEAGRAFGAFLAAMADFPPPALVPSIPGFHDLRARLRRLRAAAEADAWGRAAASGDALAGVLSVGEAVVGELASLPEAPPRHVHGDAKVANVLFGSASGEAVCVIDFDTVMPGVVLHDVGELLRTAATAAPEDEADPNAVALDLDLVAAVATGYASGCGGILTEAEIGTLAVAGEWMAVENAARFLTDHLEGDRYYAVTRTGQNLDRGRAQLRVAELLLEAEAEVGALFRRSMA